jgi:hypothetical protein
MNHNYQRISAWGAAVLAVGVTALVIALLVAYPLAEHFSITQQVVAHFMTLLSPIPLKLGYVAYITGRHQRGLAI